MSKLLKYVICTAMILWPAFLSAQTALQQAQTLFESCRYTDAASLCYGAAAIESGKTQESLYSLAKKCEKCLSLSQNAKSLYDKNDYQRAAELYKKILVLNPSDSLSRSRLEHCNAKISVALAIAEEKKLWAETIKTNDVAAYIGYLDKFPSGKNADRAKEYIAEEQLFASAKQSRSTVALYNYLESSKLKLHADEALTMIHTIEDDESWEKAKRIDTKDAYESYLNNSAGYSKHCKAARGAVAKFEAVELCRNKQYVDAYKKFELAEQWCEFNDYEIKLFALCSEEAKYAELLCSTTLENCLLFLEAWPMSKYADAVRDKAARLYADSGNFAKAYTYSKSKETEKYVKGAMKRYRKGQRYSYDAQKKNYGTDINLGLNLGLDMDFRNSSMSYTLPRVEFTAGTRENIFNFSIGVQYRRITGFNNDEESFVVGASPEFEGGWHPHLVANQIAFPAAVRFNMWNYFYISAGGSFNLNTSSFYLRSILNETEKIDTDGLALTNKYNFSSFAKTGVCFGDDVFWDIGFFVRYDITPVFNRDVIASDVVLNEDYMFNFYDSYKSIRNQVDMRFFYGFTITVTIPLN